MPGNIILHIGHGKTGSSAIQSYLAINSEILARLGLEYPYDRSFEEAKQGRITSGNPTSIYAAEPDSPKTRLFSSEFFFNDLKPGTKLYDLLKNKKGKVTVICYTRNIFDHFSSTYGQHIKRGRGTKTPEEFVENYDVFSKLSQIVDTVSDIGAELVLKNYSKVTGPIEHSFADLLLGERSAEFIREAKRIEFTINRSLTRAELAIQRYFNRHSEIPTSRYISDMLCDNVPEVSSEKVSLSRPAYDRLISKNTAHIEKVNALIDPAERIDTSAPEGYVGSEPQKTFVFTERQLEVIAQGLSAMLAGHMVPEAKTYNMSSTDVGTVRNAALKYETGENITREEALSLMKIAFKARPNGPIIRKKIEEWS